MTRRYQLQQRALSQEETRARIVEATIALHENPGPKATTISAIAERAGVQRLTVYRHFPDDAALFQACSSRWEELNPPPDPAGWARIADPDARISAALTALYRYFRRTRGMMTAVLRDEPDIPAITAALEQLRGYLDVIAVDLGKSLKTEVRGGAVATLRHAVQFQTWVSLAALCGSDEKAARLATSWVHGARSQPRKRR
ncbi:MAG: helix-turn-helix domain-containing protein [Hyphomonadaceae bacterium]|nr:helix-turn-helix domain-containing protein [Hyphomonadaceae bacterium]